MAATEKFTELPHGSCDTCNAGFFCSRLHTVMSVLKSLINENTDPLLANRFREIETRLARAGYAYPAGTVHCKYSEAPEHIRAMTDDLIKVLGQIQKNPDGIWQESNSFNEEVQSE